LPPDLKEIEILALYKQKDVVRRENYRGIKLLEIRLNLYQKVMERRIRLRVYTIH